MLWVPESRPGARMAARWQPYCPVLVRCAPRPHLKSAALLAEAQVLPINCHARRLEVVTADLQSSKRGQSRSDERSRGEPGAWRRQPPPPLLALPARPPVPAMRATHMVLLQGRNRGREGQRGVRTGKVGRLGTCRGVSGRLKQLSKSHSPYGRLARLARCIPLLGSRRG